MGAVRWKLRRPFRGERRRGRGVEETGGWPIDGAAKAAQFPTSLPAIGSPTMCLLSDLPQCATILGHNRSSQLLWQSVIVIATSCHNSSNLVGIFFVIFVQDCTFLNFHFTNMEKPHNRRLKRNECQILFVEDLDADLHLRCTNYLYFPVKGEKCLFDGRPRRANRRWPHHLLTLCNSFSCHHQTIFLHHHKSEKCTISILDLWLNYFGLLCI